MPCDASGEQADVGYEGHGGGRCGGFLPILRQPPASPEPCEQPAPDLIRSALDNPSARRNLEAPGGVGALDDLDGPRAAALHGGLELWPGVAATGRRRDAAMATGPRMDFSTAGAPSRSWMLAVWIIRPTRKPSVSVTMWRLRPFGLRPFSPQSVHRTDCRLRRICSNSCRRRSRKVRHSQ